MNLLRYFILTETFSIALFIHSIMCINYYYELSIHFNLGETCLGNSAVGKIFAFHIFDLGFIPNIAYSHLSSSRSDP